MSEIDLEEENRRLQERVKELEILLKRKNGGSTRAYDEIRAMIIGKVSKEVEQPEGLKEWMYKDDISRAERQLMSDLKWDLRIRRTQDFRDEHIEPAKEYIEKYVIPKSLKQSRWKEYKDE